jgi:hypothetical protein
MPFVLKQLNNFDNDDKSPPLRYYAGTIRVGSGKDCDLIINTEKVLPFHCELYHRGAEFRFVATQSAFVEINDSAVLKWPAVLADGDILTIGITKFQFNIIKPVPRRSWRASFASNFAIILLILLILFEVAIMVWLPYTLHKRRTWELATAKQYVVRQIDRLRAKTKGMQANEPDERSIKDLLINCEDSIAAYLRKYINNMTREQTRNVHKTLYKLDTIIVQWPHYKKAYTFQETIDPTTYINDLCSFLEKQAKHFTSPGTIVIDPKSEQ